MSDHHQVLNILPGASLDEIQQAYTRERSKLKDLAAAGDENANARLQALDEAYKALAAREQGVDEPASQATTPAEEPGPETAALVAQSASSLALQTPPEPVAQRACPHCGALNPVQATACSACNTQITHPCPQCGQPVELGMMANNHPGELLL